MSFAPCKLSADASTLAIGSYDTGQVKLYHNESPIINDLNSIETVSYTINNLENNAITTRSDITITNNKLIFEKEFMDFIKNNVSITDNNIKKAMRKSIVSTIFSKYDLSSYDGVYFDKNTLYSEEVFSTNAKVKVFVPTNNALTISMENIITDEISNDFYADVNINDIITVDTSETKSIKILRVDLSKYLVSYYDNDETVKSFPMYDGQSDVYDKFAFTIGSLTGGSVTLNGSFQETQNVFLVNDFSDESINDEYNHVEVSSSGQYVYVWIQTGTSSGKLFRSNDYGATFVEIVAPTSMFVNTNTTNASSIDNVAVEKMHIKESSSNIRIIFNLLHEGWYIDDNMIDTLNTSDFVFYSFSSNRYQYMDFDENSTKVVAAIYNENNITDIVCGSPSSPTTLVNLNTNSSIQGTSMSNDGNIIMLSYANEHFTVSIDGGNNWYNYQSDITTATNRMVTNDGSTIYGWCKNTSEITQNQYLHKYDVSILPTTSGSSVTATTFTDLSFVSGISVSKNGQFVFAYNTTSVFSDNDTYPVFFSNDSGSSFTLLPNITPNILSTFRQDTLQLPINSFGVSDNNHVFFLDPDTLYSLSSTHAIQVSEGFTWVSTYAGSPPSGSNTIPVVFPDPLVGMSVYSQTQIASYNSSSFGTSWNANFEFNKYDGYKLFIPEQEQSTGEISGQYTFTVTGIVTATTQIDLIVGWNWISYPSIVTRGIATVITNPEIGDNVFSQTSVSSYNSSSFGTNWNNTSFVFETGKGYKYYSVSNKTLIISTE